MECDVNNIWYTDATSSNYKLSLNYQEPQRGNNDNKSGN